MSGLNKNILTKGFLVLRVATIRIPINAGRAASLSAYIETEPPGTSPIPPVKSVLTAPRILKTLYFFLLIKSYTPYPTGNNTAVPRRIEATSELSLGVRVKSPMKSPNHSSPFLRIKIGSNRLKNIFTQRFSLKLELVD